MKKFIVVILLFLPGIAFAQREAYNWYFPSNRAVTFNTKDGHPVSLTDGNLYGGSPATYSDSEGNLLFYSNGDTVWNRLHKPMPMGFLDNNLSYVRYGTMIFPKPGSISQYYIFYIDQSTKNPNLKFSVVDMNLDNGFGDVVLPNSSLDSSIASFSAVNHANGIDVWLITYDYQIMQFKVYLISKSGINSNQKSFSSNPDNQSYNPDNNGIYTSPKGNFFVFHQYFITDLYSFDNRTGNVNFLTNIDTILQNSKQHFHGWFGGSEFSESGKRIFIFSLDSLPGSKNSFCGLTNQYNLDIPDIHQIRSTKLLVHADSGDIHYGNICAGIGFKLGPDKRIYFSYCDWRYLSCISFPDSFGISCDFQYNKIPILKGFDNLNGGLQNILPCYYCFYAFANSPICEGDTIFLSANLSKRFLSPKFEWSGPNGFSSFEQSPVIINSKYENTGLYRLKVTADTTDLYDSVYVQVYPRPIAQILTQGDLDLCKTASVILSSKETDKTFIYHWSTGESKQKIPVKVPGVYILTVTNPAGCSSVDSIEVKGIEKFAISAIGSPAICYGDTTELFVTPINKEYRYSWSTGDTTPNTKISKAGIYKVFVSYLNCLDSAFIIVDSLPTPKPKINGPNSVCLNSVVDYYLSYNPNTKKSWSISGGSIQKGDGENDITVKWNINGTGIITVSLTDTTTGCTGSDTLYVTVGDVLKPKISSDRKALCPGGTATISAPDGYTEYLWSNNETNKSINITKSGNYWVHVKDGSGCEGNSDTINIIDVPAPQPTLLADTLLCPGSTAKISVVQNFVSYKWSSGETSKEITVSQAGTYSVVVTDTNGCTGTASIEIKQFALMLTGLTDLYFGKTKPNTPVTNKLTLKNESNSPIRISKISTKSGSGLFSFITNPPLPASINVNGSIEIEVTFTPTESKTYSDSLIAEIDLPCPIGLSSFLTGEAGVKTIVWLPDTTGKVGDKDFCIPLRSNFIEPYTENLSFNAKIKFDATAFLPDAIYGSYIVGADRYVELSANNINLTEKQTILSDFCGTILLALNDRTPLYIEQFEWSDKNIEIEKQDGSLTLTGLCIRNLSRLKLIETEELILSPNPVVDWLEISYSPTINRRVNPTVDYQGITIFNVFGEKVLSTSPQPSPFMEREFPPRLTSSATLQEGNLRIDVSDLSPGIYFVRIGDSVRKFIKIDK